MADEVRSPRPCLLTECFLSCLRFMVTHRHTKAHGHSHTGNAHTRAQTHKHTHTRSCSHARKATQAQSAPTVTLTCGTSTHMPPTPTPPQSHSSHTHPLSEDRSREGLCLWTSLRRGKGEKCPRASLLPLLGQEVASLTFWGLRPELGGIHTVTSAQARVGWVGMGVETGPEKGQGQPGSVVEEVIGLGAKSRPE